RQAVLLGSPGTKRTIYLEKGAEAEGISFRLLDWKEFPFRSADSPASPLRKDLVLKNDFRDDTALADPFWNETARENVFLKIDPPLWESCCLDELNILARDYEKKLQWLAELGKKRQITFLNKPEDILALLDKRACKRRLAEAGIPVTEELDGIGRAVFPVAETLDSVGQAVLPVAETLDGVGRADLLLGSMERRRIFQVFIKPVCGSGAAGAAAFRWQPRSGRMILYTCAMENPETGRLVNTKRLRRFTDRKQVLSMIGRLLELGCIVERWYAKAEHNGFSYDLRAVVQDGRMDFILARLSSGPITNLHLNNHPLKGNELGLPCHVMEDVEQLCIRAAGCYPELRSVGIDVLLEKGSLRPRIIELNGQGDLIYQDIYDQNRIYLHQAEMMKEWLMADFISRDHQI
ncbi:STM4014 family protein, partial [Schaedlerella sp.]|uniref:STM4014 family protein n=1 Tax=Schaedlerella sp. TaxID=2676057 RepID=UPI003744EA8C